MPQRRGYGKVDHPIIDPDFSSVNRANLDGMELAAHPVQGGHFSHNMAVL